MLVVISKQNQGILLFPKILLIPATVLFLALFVFTESVKWGEVVKVIGLL